MRKLYLFSMAVLSSLFTFAQSRMATAGSAGSSAVQLGIKAGVNIAHIKDNRLSNNDRVGFHAGVLAHIHVTPNVAVQPEVMYSLQGADYTEAPDLVGTTNLSYINVPVLLQYMNSGFRLQTGPQIGFAVKNEFKYDRGGTTNFTPTTNDVDFSWSFGVGYLTAARLGIDARYNLGISKISRPANSPKDYNRVWQFGVFYQFGQ